MNAYQKIIIPKNITSHTLRNTSQNIPIWKHKRSDSVMLSLDEISPSFGVKHGTKFIKRNKKLGS